MVLRGTCSLARVPVHPRVCGEHYLTGRRCKSQSPVHPRVCGEHSSRRPRRSSRIAVHPRVCGEHSPATQSPTLPSNGSSPRVRGTYLIVTACYSLDYMPCKIATDDLTPDSPTPHMPRTYFTQAKKIRVEDRQNPQVSGGLCQRFQTQIPRHWGRPKQSQHHRRR